MEWIHLAQDRVFCGLSFIRWWNFMFWRHGVSCLQGLKSGSSPFVLGLPIKMLHFLFLPCVLHALPISPAIIWSSSYYVMKRRNYEAAHYAVCGILL
jgi:hypothetical protein